MVSIRVSDVFIFFFSSRRRHTRYWRDWSSDVCSSDLYNMGFITDKERYNQVIDAWTHVNNELGDVLMKEMTEADQGFNAVRSEERRVGKECRSRWSPYH